MIMVWLAVAKNGTEIIFQDKPSRTEDDWKPAVIGEELEMDDWGDVEYVDAYDDKIYLPKGSIKKLIGRELSWKDEPVELKEG